MNNKTPFELFPIFENIQTLLKHSERNLSALYKCRDDIENSDLLSRDEIKKYFDGVEKNKNVELRHAIKHEVQDKFFVLYNTLVHNSELVAEIHKFLREYERVTVSFDFSIYGCIFKRVLKLFVYYIKLNIALAFIPNVHKFLHMYIESDRSVGAGSNDLLNDIENRSNLKHIEKNVGFMKDILSNFTLSNHRDVHDSLSLPSMDTNLFSLLSSKRDYQHDNRYFDKNDFFVELSLTIDVLSCFTFTHYNYCTSDDKILRLMALIFANNSQFQIINDWTVGYEDILKKFKEASNQERQKTKLIRRIVAEKKEEFEYINKKRMQYIYSTLCQFVFAIQTQEDNIQKFYYVIFSFLGYASFHIFNFLISNKSLDHNKDIIFVYNIHLLHILFRELLNYEDELRSYFFYNFSLYDSEYIDYMISSSAMPETRLQAAKNIKEALSKCNFAEFEQGTPFDLTGLQYMISEELYQSIIMYSSSNQRVPIHLYPLFRLYNHIHLKLSLFNNYLLTLLDVFPIHKLWPFSHALLNVLKENHSPELLPSIICLSSFYEYDYDFFSENASKIDYVRIILKEMVNLYVDRTKRTIVNIFEYKKRLLTVCVFHKYSGSSEDKAKIESLNIGISDKLNKVAKDFEIVYKIGPLRLFGNDELDVGASVIASFENTINSGFASFFEFKSPAHFDSILVSFVDFIRVMSSIFRIQAENMISRVLKRYLDNDVQLENNNIVVRVTSQYTSKLLAIYKDFFESPHKYVNYNKKTFCFENRKDRKETSFNVNSLLSYNSFELIYKTGGITSIVILDKVASDQLIKRLSEFFQSKDVHNYIKEFSKRDEETEFLKYLKNVLRDKSFLSLCESLIEEIIAMGILIKFRRILRDSIDLSNSDAEKFSFMLSNTKLRNDTYVRQKLSSIEHNIISFNNNTKNYVRLFGTLMISNYWRNSAFDKHLGTFTTNPEFFTFFYDFLLDWSSTLDNPVRPTVFYINFLNSFVDIQKEFEKKESSMGSIVELMCLNSEFVRFESFQNKTRTFRYLTRLNLLGY